MVAYQYHGEIYYRTFKAVYPGNELMVWYGEQYAEELGISVQYTGKYKNYNSYIIQRNVSILDTLVSEILSVIEIYIYPNFRGHNVL